MNKYTALCVVCDPFSCDMLSLNAEDFCILKVPLYCGTAWNERLYILLTAPPPLVNNLCPWCCFDCVLVLGPDAVFATLVVWRWLATSKK